MSKTHNSHIVRDKYRELLISNIGLSEEEATDLEVGIFNSTIDYANSVKIHLSWMCSIFMETYINNARSVYTNLKEDSYVKNKSLMKRLKDKEFLPHDLAYMTMQDMFPDRWKETISKIDISL